MKKDKLNTLIQEDFSFAIIDKSKDKLINFKLGDIELIIKLLSDTIELISKLKKPAEEKDIYCQIKIW